MQARNKARPGPIKISSPRLPDGAYFGRSDDLERRPGSPRIPGTYGDLLSRPTLAQPTVGCVLTYEGVFSPGAGGRARDGYGIGLGAAPSRSRRRDDQVSVSMSEEAACHDNKVPLCAETRGCVHSLSFNPVVLFLLCTMTLTMFIVRKARILYTQRLTGYDSTS
jgi:hypothetical protein